MLRPAREWVIWASRFLTHPRSLVASDSCSAQIDHRARSRRYPRSPLVFSKPVFGAPNCFAAAVRVYWAGLPATR